jgi:ParB family transcriptional regulator, chromosome partitioning protein
MQVNVSAKQLKGELSCKTRRTLQSVAYRSVPISILVESATNPRKRFDEKNLEELAASMRVQGILAPLLVRE